MLSLVCEQNSLLWQLFRQNPTRISASEAGSCLQVSEFKSRYSLVNEKRNRSLEERVFSPERKWGSEAIRHGRKMESKAIEVARKLLDPHGIFVWKKPGLFVDRLFHTSCSPDALFFYGRDSDTSIEMHGLEVKNPYTRPIPKRICDITPDHLLQCFFSIHTCRADSWYLFYYREEPEVDYSLFQIYPHIYYWHDYCQPRIQECLDLINNPYAKVLKNKKKYSQWRYAN